VVCREKFDTLVVPSRFSSTVKAQPAALDVSVGMVPAASENMLNANVLPEVETPSGELSAGPKRLTWNVSVEANVNPWK
jgi:hypothetical protein